VGHDHDNQQNKTKGKVHWMPEINGSSKKKKKPMLTTHLHG